MSEAAQSPSSPDQDAPRVIGGLAAFSIVAGSMIGVGIFVYVSNIAAGVGSVPLFFGLILLGGLFALAGSVACGELGAMMPKAGGDYVFQRAAFGPSISFASGWVLFAAIFAGSNAALAIAVFQFDIGPLLGVDMRAPIIEGTHLTGGHLGAAALIIVLTFINDMGTSISAKAQTILTFAPIIALVGLGLYIFIADPAIVNPPKVTTVPDGLSLEGLAGAFLAVNFIFSGWINIIYVASEVKNPGRTIPRSMISATAAVTALYVFMGAVFVFVLGIDGIAALGWTDAGTATATALGGKPLVPVALIIITVAILTSINGTVMGAARVGTAMAQNGAFWKPIAKLSGPNKSPRRALWLGAGISVLIIASGTTDAIVKMTSLAMFVTGTLTVASLFVLRRKLPHEPRPYRATLYPFLPALYIVLAVCAIAATLWGAIHCGGTAEECGEKSVMDAWYPLTGLGILAVTWMGHLLYLRRWKSAAVVGVGFLLGGALFENATRPTPQAHAAGVSPAAAVPTAVSPAAAVPTAVSPAAAVPSAVNEEMLPADDVRPHTP